MTNTHPISWLGSLRRLPTGAFALALALLLQGASVMAQDKPSREREALRRVQQALRTAQEETATLQRDKAQLAAEKDAIANDKGRLDQALRQSASQAQAATAQVRSTQARATQLEAELSAARQEIEALKTQLAGLSRQSQEQQQTVVSIRDLLQRNVQARQVLEARNAQLYKVGAAVIEMYRSARPADTLARQEPFFGIGAVTLDNVAEIWMDRLEQARYQDADKLPP